MKSKFLVLITISLLVLTSCAYSHASMHNLYTEDCGKSWKVIPVGESIPSLRGVCGYPISLPDSPLVGDIKYRINFANKVTAELATAFTYRIVDPISYIQSAKFLAKPRNNGADSNDANSQTNALEIAENNIIDRVIREESSEVLVTEDIATYDPQKVDTAILSRTNAVLKARGIELDFIQNTVIPDPLTRTALDAVAAKRIFESQGMGEEGNKIMEAKAGSATINLNSGNTSQSTTTNNTTTNNTTSSPSPKS